MRPVQAGTTINGLRFGFPYSFYVGNFPKNVKLANMKYNLFNFYCIMYIL